MKILYFDCFAGIAGDMILGALIDLGLDLRQLEKELAKLPLVGYRLDVQSVKKQAIRAIKLKVLLQGEAGERPADAEFEEVDPGSEAPDPASHSHHPTVDQEQGHETPAVGYPARSLGEILDLIDSSDLSSSTRSIARAIFTRLGEAEAVVHNQPLEEVHLHEVGAVDALVDIVGAAIGLELLGVEEVYASALHLGSGFVRTAHGLLPVPAPATAALLEGIPVYTTQAKGELVTPTGAAFIATVARGFGPMPEMRVKAVGYGAGSCEREFPNVLRAFLGERVGRPAARSNRKPYPEQHDTPVGPGGYHISPAVMIEANIDDMLPQLYEALVERLFEADALDVVMAPVQMKKNRPGIQLQVLASPDSIDRLLAILFRESTTIGARTYEVQKRMLQRQTVTIQTPFGEVRVKVARLGDQVVNAAPEYEDCRSRAAELGLPIKEVYNAALSAIQSYLLGNNQ
jgi:pyridinium-3,5-bisthiocarboxylic acid mononucleotide nickel chelatase